MQIQYQNSCLYLLRIMMKNVVEYQVSSMKTHPHIKKVQIVADRLLQVIYYPKNVKSEYSKMQYRVKLELPHNYPENPPIVKFMDPISHPNICMKTGQVKMPLLQEDWSSYITLYIIIDLLDTLLLQPETDQKYCPNNKTKTSNDKNMLLTKFRREDSVIQRSGKRVITQQYQKEEDQNMQRTRPIQSMKNKLKRMKTIILQKAEDKDYTQSVEIRGSQGKNQNQRKELTKNNKLSKISEEEQLQHSKVHIESSDQFLQTQQQPRTTVRAIKSPQNTYFIPRSYSKNIIQSGSSYLARSRNVQMLQKTKSNSKQLKKDKIRIPTLRRNTIDQQLIDVLHKDVTSTTTLEQSSHQLDKINKLLNNFYSEYEDLVIRRGKTKSSQLIEIIQQKMREQLGLIEQLNDLSMLVKKKMILEVKNYISK